MTTREVVHILIRKPHPDGGITVLRKSLCGRENGPFAYKNRIRNFYPNTCKHCIKAQITTYDRRKPDRDKRQTERRGTHQ